MMKKLLISTKEGSKAIKGANRSNVPLDEPARTTVKSEMAYYG